MATLLQLALLRETTRVWKNHYEWNMKTMKYTNRQKLCDILFRGFTLAGVYARIEDICPNFSSLIFYIFLEGVAFKWWILCTLCLLACQERVNHRRFGSLWLCSFHVFWALIYDCLCLLEFHVPCIYYHAGWLLPKAIQVFVVVSLVVRLMPVERY